MVSMSSFFFATHKKWKTIKPKWVGDCYISRTIERRHKQNQTAGQRKANIKRHYAPADGGPVVQSPSNRLHLDHDAVPHTNHTDLYCICMLNGPRQDLIFGMGRLLAHPLYLYLMQWLMFCLKSSLNCLTLLRDEFQFVNRF